MFAARIATEYSQNVRHTRLCSLNVPTVYCIRDFPSFVQKNAGTAL